MPNALEVFAERGILEQVTDNDALKRLFDGSDPVVVYAGFDPTADSLHVGHLLPIMALAHLQRLGHQPVVLVGGATGLIGDPSGKSSERQVLSHEQVSQNSKELFKQLSSFLRVTGENKARMVNNLDWIGKINLVDWLRGIGKRFAVNTMIKKDSVQRRLESGGISYTEFSYQLLQAYDFVYLHESLNCMVQVGGSDQWGNIVNGIEYASTKGYKLFGLTLPLVTTSAGEKFGKSAGNAIWLSATKTTPYAFYQFWLNTPDADARKYLKFFTFIPVEEINALMTQHNARPEPRWAQKRLALEVTSFVHGTEMAKRVARASEVLFDVCDMNFEDIEVVFRDTPGLCLSEQELQDKNIITLMVEGGLCHSKGAARRLMQGNGVYLNNQRVTDLDRKIHSEDLLQDRMCLIRVGRQKILWVLKLRA